MNEKEEFHGYSNCDVCGSQNVWCNSFKSAYKFLHFKKACEECNKKISKGAGLLGYGVKQDWQIVQAKAITLDIHAKHLKAEYVCKLKLNNNSSIMDRLLNVFIRWK